MTRTIRYIVVCDDDVTLLEANVSRDVLERFFQFCSEAYGYDNVFYFDSATKTITVIKGEISFKYLDR